MQDTSSSQLSPEALEQKYSDVLSQFQTMVTADKETQNVVDSEKEQDVEPLPALQQLSPVSKFLHNIQPDSTEHKEAADVGSETEFQMAAAAHHSAEGDSLPHDQSASSMSNNKSSRPSPPRFTDDSVYHTEDRDHSYDLDHTASQQPHIPRQLLQQLAAQQLRIAELEQEVAKEKKQDIYHAAQVHDQKQAMETLQQELSQYKAAASHAAQQAATLRHDLVIAHAARNDADARAAACASELIQLKKIHEAQVNVDKHTVATCTAEDDMQHETEEASTMQERLDEAKERLMAASEEINDLRNALKEAMEVNDAAVAREEEAVREQLAATEREATATTRQEEWKKAAEAAAVLAEASIAQANTAKAAAASAQADLQAAKMESKAASSSPGPGHSLDTREANITTPEHGKHANSESPHVHQPGCSPAMEVRVPAFTLRVLNKVQQRLWERFGRESVRFQQAQSVSSEATGTSPQVKRKRSSRNGVRGIPAASFDVVEALDDVLSSEKQLLQRHEEAVQAAECQAAEMSRLQHDFHCSVAHSETLTHRIHTMEAEAAVLRSALVETEAARAADAETVAASQRVGAHPAELRSTGMQAGLPASLTDHSSGGSNMCTGCGTSVLSVSVCTQTEAGRGPICEAAGTQTDDESLKDERLRVWKEVEENKTNSSDAHHRQASMQSWDQNCQEYIERPSRTAASRYTYDRTPSQPQQEHRSGHSRNSDDMSGHVEWVHGKHGCAAFVGDSDFSVRASDVLSTCAQNSPSSHMQGQRSPLDGGFQTNGGQMTSDRSSKASVGLQQSYRGHGGHDVTCSMEQHPQRRQASKRRGIADARDGLEHDECERTPEFEATARTPQRHGRAPPSRGRSASVPPQQAQKCERSQRDPWQDDDNTFAAQNQRQHGAVDMQEGQQRRSHRDRSVPARRPRQQEGRERMMHADHGTHHNSPDDDEHGWTRDTSAQMHQFEEVMPLNSAEDGRHRRTSSWNRVLSDSKPHAPNLESIPPAFAPDHDAQNSFEEVEYTQASTRHSPSCAAAPQQPKNLRPTAHSKAGHSLDLQPYSRQQNHPDGRPGSQLGAAALATSAECRSKVDPAHSVPGPAPECGAAPQGVVPCIEDTGTDGFDDGLRDLVARLDEIQRKQAAALAQISESATTDDQNAWHGNRKQPLSPDRHSDSARGSGPVRHAYDDGIPTPETVLGLENSPDPWPPPSHWSHASMQLSTVALAQDVSAAKHHKNCAPHSAISQSRSDEHVSTRVQPYRPSKSIRTPGYINGHSVLPSTNPGASRPLHHSADWTSNTYTAGKNDYHTSLPVRSFPTRQSHVSGVHSGAPRAHASSMPPAVSSGESASAWRARVHVRQALSHAELQPHAAAGTPTVQWQAHSPSLSRSASILEAAARQCSEKYVSGKFRKSADGSVMDAPAAPSTSGDSLYRTNSAPATPIPQLRNSLGTPTLCSSHRDIERSSGQYGLQIRSSTSTTLPPHRPTTYSQTSRGTGQGTSDGFCELPTRPPQQATRRTDHLRHSGPPRYGAFSSTKSMHGSGQLHHAPGLQNYAAPLLRTRTEEKMGESNGTVEVSRGGDEHGERLQHRDADQTSRIRPHLSASTWSRLRREHLGRGSLAAESSSDSDSV